MTRWSRATCWQASLLRVAAKQGIARNYVRRLLAAVNKTEDSTPASQGLIEPLSERELDVLRQHVDNEREVDGHVYAEAESADGRADEKTVEVAGEFSQ